MKRHSAAPGRALVREGSKVCLLNPLNWKRSDPVLAVPDGRTLDGVPPEIQPDGRMLTTSPTIASMTITVLSLAPEPAEKPRAVDPAEPIETTHYVAGVNQKTGALASLRLKPSGREMLAWLRKSRSPAAMAQRYLYRSLAVPRWSIQGRLL